MVALLRLGDLLAAAGSWVGGFYLRLLLGRIGWLKEFELTSRDLAQFLPVALILTMVIFSRLGLYEPKRVKRLMFQTAGVVRAVFGAWGISYVILSFSRTGGLSRGMMGLVLLIWLAAAIGSRIAARAALNQLRRHGRNLRSAAIVGTGRLGQKLHQVLDRNKWTGIVPRYFVASAAEGRKLFGLDVLGPAGAIDAVLATQPVDIVFVALPGRQHAEIEQVLDRLATTNAEVEIVPDLLSFHFLKHDVTQLDELPVITLTYSPQHGWNSVLKRALDVVGSVVALAVLSIPMLIIAAAVKLTSKGPVFYSQKRTSLGGRPFRIIKFRTMVRDAEAQTGPVWAARNDPRITRMGRFLRRTSLDELPQLFNVLLGQMSLVGPRPERPELIERFRDRIPRYMLRHQVKPGLTGWAQVHGLRGLTSLRKRVQYDLYYIANWSFGLDLRILLVSPFRGLVHPNAY